MKWTELCAHQVKLANQPLHPSLLILSPPLPPLYDHLSTKGTAVPELPHEVGHKESGNTENDREESRVWEAEHVEPLIVVDHCAAAAIAGVSVSS